MKVITKEKIRNAIILIALIAIAIVMAVGGWIVMRDIHYSVAYEDKVKETFQKELQPLKDKIKTLEEKIKKLENEA